MKRVVALMPTFNRPALAHRAVHMFLEQSYAGPKHMVIFDDGDNPVVLCPSCSSQVELVRCARMNLPTKRNAMMQHVRDADALYFMWDDDDYHGPDRVLRQVDVLQYHRACVMRPTLYYNEISDEIRVSRWLSDATVAYNWAFWSTRGGFDVRTDPGSGFRFVYNSDAVAIHGELDYMVVVHAGQRHTPPAFGPPDFVEAPVTPSWARERLQPRYLALSSAE